MTNPFFYFYGHIIEYNLNLAKIIFIGDKTTLSSNSSPNLLKVKETKDTYLFPNIVELEIKSDRELGCQRTKV